MPLITLRANKLASESVRDSLAKGLSDITETTLRKNRQVIVVRFETTQDDQWYIAGTEKKDDQAIFELNILVTKGTNTDDEKAAWLQQTWELLIKILGSAAHSNYISVQEIDAKSWGYNGLSQEQRKIQAI